MDSPRALEDIRVLITRPRERSEELGFLLEDEGAEVVYLPVLEFARPDNDLPLQAAAEHIQKYAWVAFASPTAVDAFVEAVREAGSMERLRRCRIAAVGPKTAQTVSAFGFRVEVQADVSTGTGLYEKLAPLLSVDDEILLPAAQDGRLELAHALEAQGCRVTRVAAYRSTEVALSPDAWADLGTPLPRAVLFASPRTVQAFVDGLDAGKRDWLQTAARVAIGPTTAQALGELGLQATAVADEPTPLSLVEATIRAVRG